MAENFKFALTCIQAIKDFDGTDPSQLPDFISQIESLYIFVDMCEDIYKHLLFTYIKNKCTGTARHVIQNTDNCTSWIIFKDALKRHFGEKEHTTTLMDQLKLLQLQGTIEKFYFKITQLVKRINNRRLTHDECTFSHSEISRTALNTFKNHLPEPTKTLILARNPSTLEDAYKRVLEAKHENFSHYGPPSGTYRTNFNDPRPQYNKRNIFQHRNNNYKNNNDNNSHNAKNNNNRHNNVNNNYRSNNNYSNNNNDNRYNNKYNNNNQNYNRYANSGNTRQSYNTSRQSHNTRQTQNTYNTSNTNNNNTNNNTVQPMVIGQHDINFLTDASNVCHT